MTWQRLYQIGCGPSPSRPCLRGMGGGSNKKNGPKSQDNRVALARQIGADGVLLLEALEGPTAPAAARDLPMVQTLREVWRGHFFVGEEPPPLGEKQEPPAPA